MKKNKYIKLMTILGTRPEIIQLSRILPQLDENFNHKIVFTKQSYAYELSEIFFDEFGLRKPDYLLNVKAKTLGGQIANIFSQTEQVLVKEKPDALFVLGDTNSTLSAVLAKRLKILIFHMEAGNRSFDWEVPEELNRRIVDHISDYNLCYTKHAKEYLVKEGIAPQRIFVVGSPFSEVFSHFSDKISSSTILKDLQLEPRRYFLVSAHREENIDNDGYFHELFHAFNSLAKIYNLPIIVSCHPRTRKRLNKSTVKLNNSIKLLKPFGYFDYNKLQKEALCVLSDSGSIQEESAILGFRAVQIRKSTERPEAFDTGSIILSGWNKDAVLSAVDYVIKQDKKGETIVIPDDYKDVNVSSKVVKLIMGLTGVKIHHDRLL